MIINPDVGDALEDIGDGLFRDVGLHNRGDEDRLGDAGDGMFPGLSPDDLAMSGSWDLPGLFAESGADHFGGSASPAPDMLLGQPAPQWDAGYALPDLALLDGAGCGVGAETFPDPAICAAELPQHLPEVVADIPVMW